MSALFPGCAINVVDFNDSDSGTTTQASDPQGNTSSSTTGTTSAGDTETDTDTEGPESSTGETSEASGGEELCDPQAEPAGEYLNGAERPGFVVDGADTRCVGY